jgi:hypothetical protein
MVATHIVLLGEKSIFLVQKKVVNPRLFFSAGVGHNSSIGLL